MEQIIKIFPKATEQVNQVTRKFQDNVWNISTRKITLLFLLSFLLVFSFFCYQLNQRHFFINGNNVKVEMKTVKSDLQNVQETTNKLSILKKISE